MRVLLVPAAIALTLIGVADALLDRWAPQHFLPEQKLDVGIASGPDCILLLGDSRMDAAYSSPEMHEALRRHNADRCISDLSVGATDISGAYLTAREYLSRGERPRLVVIGKVADSLLDPDSRRDPQQMVGNNAIHLVWSRASDVYLEVPGFPNTSIDVFDAGFRFLVARASALGRYQSLFWLHVQRAQDLLVGANPLRQNRFGRVADMGQLEADLRLRAVSRMQQSMEAPSGLGLERWFTRLIDLLHNEGIPFVVVELPMRKVYRHDVTTTFQAFAYQRRLAQQISTLGGILVDLGEVSWIDESLFADALHLNRGGAHKLSNDLGDRLASISSTRAPF